MFCTRCGSDLRETDRFCSQCGVNIASPYSSTPQPARQLARTMYDKKIAGVCGGFARYFDCDVTLMRIIFLILAFGTGVGFIAYIIGWIAMPKDYGEALTPTVNVNLPQRL
jgi:phage shock protein C